MRQRGVGAGLDMSLLGSSADALPKLHVSRSLRTTRCGGTTGVGHG